MSYNGFMRMVVFFTFLFSGGFITIDKSYAQINPIAAGNGHALAICQDSSGLSWGRNVVGQLGDGTTQSDSVPGAIINIKHIRSMDGGRVHTIAVASDSTVWGWEIILIISWGRIV